jgi:hypothetical protein
MLRDFGRYQKACVQSVNHVRPSSISARKSSSDVNGLGMAPSRTGLISKMLWSVDLAAAGSEIASQLLATFDSLPPQEQHELLTAMLRRSGELPDSGLSDDGLVGLADDLCQTRDAEGSHSEDA